MKTMIDIEEKKGVSEQEMMENVSATSIVEVLRKWTETNDDRSVLCVVGDEHGNIGVFQDKDNKRLIKSIVMAAFRDEEIEFALRRALDVVDLMKQVMK